MTYLSHGQNLDPQLSKLKPHVLICHKEKTQGATRQFPLYSFAGTFRSDQ
jgi:hypothetical protein